MRPASTTFAVPTTVATEELPSQPAEAPQPTEIHADQIYTTIAAEPTETSMEALPTNKPTPDESEGPIYIPPTTTDSANPTEEPSEEPLVIQTTPHNPTAEETDLPTTTGSLEIQPTEEVEWVYEDELDEEELDEEDGAQAAEADTGKAVAALFAELVMYLRDLTPAANATLAQQIQPTKTLPLPNIMQTELTEASGIDVDAAQATETHEARQTIAWIEVAPTQWWS